jgi:hypothetical protein
MIRVYKQKPETSRRPDEDLSHSNNCGGAKEVEEGT